jgi:hypothetical protein
MKHSTEKYLDGMMSLTKIWVDLRELPRDERRIQFKRNLGELRDLAVLIADLVDDLSTSDDPAATNLQDMYVDRLRLAYPDENEIFIGGCQEMLLGLMHSIVPVLALRDVLQSMRAKTQEGEMFPEEVETAVKNLINGNN